MRLKNDALKMILKILAHVGKDIFGAASPYFKLTQEADIEVKRTISQGTIFEEEQVLGFVFTALKEARFHFATECTADDMQDPTGLRPGLRYLAPVIQALRSGLSTARHDIPLDWRKQYPTRHYQIMSGTYNPNNSSTGNGGSYNQNSSSPGNGGNYSNASSNALGAASLRRFQINERMQTALRPIVTQHGRRIHLGSLLRHANTNYSQLLGERFENHCIKAVLTGQCHQNCTRNHENPTPEELINRIIHHITPGINQCVQRGPIAQTQGSLARR